MEHGATQKRRSTGYDPHITFSDFTSRILLFSSFLLPCFIRNPCQAEEERFFFLSLRSERERETKSFWGTKKKETVSFLVGQEGFVRAKRKFGGTLGKAREIILSFEMVVFVRTLFSPSPFFLLYVSSTAPRQKQQTSQPTTGETARVQGGMDWEPVIRAFSFFFSFSSDGIGTDLGLGLVGFWIDPGITGTTEGKHCYLEQ